MTIAAEPRIDLDVQHLVLSDVSWGFYEAMLKEIGNRPLRVTYDDGELEIISPLPQREWASGVTAGSSADHLQAPPLLFRHFGEQVVFL